jgi:hypothetical protein
VYHYPLVTLLVVDHTGSGTPVAFGIIASHEGGDDVAAFIEDVEEITGIKIGTFLIDKSKVCRKTTRMPCLFRAVWSTVCLICL